MLPAPHRFRPADSGVAYWVAGVTLNTLGTQYVVSFDTGTLSLFGFAEYEVTGSGMGDGAGSPFELFATEVLGGRKSAGR